jgi:transcription termination factor Rho
VSKETLIGKILEHQTVKADPSLDFKMESWRMISQKSSLFQKSYSKAKITPVYNNEPATVVTELKGNVPAEVSSQIEAVNEGISK